ncbi:hypothetical protein O181_023642 [Austropuccinia psidii MF-1]|uniref:Velvet domain-containing protein n=1 Tax=Austropuccinia psidii MF-1 TaxID=1389203 RepID=A0A9Q3GY76_9BASI|nr:hypothetical protein [Austropuccinia psidii MF-1]
MNTWEVLGVHYTLGLLILATLGLQHLSAALHPGALLTNEGPSTPYYTYNTPLNFEHWMAGPSTSRSRSYHLRILQQPVRARMCGFGDRDRRLLTPPVIVELLVRDSQTGRPIDPDDVDTKFFVLNADLWDSTCTQEANIVMHPVFFNSDTKPSFASSSTHTSSNQEGPATSSQSSYRHMVGTSSDRYASAPHSYAPPTSEIAYTRNLIGALAQSALKLKGMDNRPGIFFIFHDISIRTEGVFCFRFVFLSLENGLRTTESTNVLASIFTEPFQVFSAKKFPGMLGPTELTRHFAAQRVRIPTRTRKYKDEGAEGTDEEVEGE